MFSHQKNKEVQARLEELGCNPGVIDGVWGEKTDKAMRRFQRTHGLKDDGILGPITAAIFWTIESKKDEDELSLEPVKKVSVAYNFTQQKLEACITENKHVGTWFADLEKWLQVFDINTVNRVAGFLSQTAIESAYYTKTSENLNYSASGLLKVFPKYFTAEQAKLYERKPEKIANRVYANRLGNGDEASGDGWEYRGRGLIQVTGKFNYTDCSKWLFGDDRLVKNPELLTQSEYAVKSAIWYWTIHDLNELADRQDVTAMTKRINGGTHGLAARKTVFERSVKVLLA
jgi:putative chitinase